MLWPDSSRGRERGRKGKEEQDDSFKREDGGVCGGAEGKLDISEREKRVSRKQDACLVRLAEGHAQL